MPVLTNNANNVCCHTGINVFSFLVPSFRSRSVIALSCLKSREVVWNVANCIMCGFVCFLAFSVTLFNVFHCDKLGTGELLSKVSKVKKGGTVEKEAR